jgi:hypothetical protein
MNYPRWKKVDVPSSLTDSGVPRKGQELSRHPRNLSFDSIETRSSGHAGSGRMALCRLALCRPKALRNIHREPRLACARDFIGSKEGYTNQFIRINQPHCDMIKWCIQFHLQPQLSEQACPILQYTRQDQYRPFATNTYYRHGPTLLSGIVRVYGFPGHTLNTNSCSTVCLAGYTYRQTRYANAT